MAQTSSPIPFNFRGTPYFKEAFGNTLGSGGGEQIVLTDDAVPANKKRLVYKALLSTSFSGLMLVKIGTTVIGSDRTRPGKPTACVEWVPPRAIAEGEQVTITYEQLHGVAASFEAYLMAEDVQLT